MLVDAAHLRWLGIDMRPRWRRQVAVVLTYAAFLVAVWAHSRQILGVLQGLLYAQLMSGLWWAVEKTFPVWARRAMVGVVLLGAMAFVRSPVVQPHLYTDVPLGAAFLMVAGSVVGWRKLVEPSDAGWLARAIAAGDAQSWRKQRRMARLGFAVGLDGFAWYEYGMRFKKLTVEQKLEIEQLRRSNPRGKWMRERQTVLFDDERMRQEDDRMNALVKRIMSGVLVVSALGWSWIQAVGYSTGSEIVVAYVWTLAVLSVTVRQAIVLWTEEDQRLTDEIELVGKEA